MKQILKNKHSQSLVNLVFHACVFLVLLNFKTNFLNANVHVFGFARGHRAVLL